MEGCLLPASGKDIRDLSGNKELSEIDLKHTGTLKDTNAEA